MTGTARRARRRASAQVVLPTLEFRQSRALCGPACLKIVFAYFGVDLPERYFAKVCRSSRRTGTTGANLVRGAKRLGFRAEIFDETSFRAMQSWLRRGIPPIVDWTSTDDFPRGRRPLPCGHYAVVRGLDAEFIFLQDPAAGRRRLGRKAFLNAWYDFEHAIPRRHDLVLRRMLIVTPKETPPRLA